MNILMTIVTVVQVLCALGVIGLVLLQHGKGADMGAAFGSGTSGSLFGASGSANFLSRTTAVLATLFFVCTLALAFLSNGRTAAAPRSVMEQQAVKPPADAIPGGAPAAPSPGASGQQGGVKAVPGNEIPK